MGFSNCAREKSSLRKMALKRLSSSLCAAIKSWRLPRSQDASWGTTEQMRPLPTVMVPVCAAVGSSSNRSRLDLPLPFFPVRAIRSPRSRVKVTGWAIALP